MEFALLDGHPVNSPNARFHISKGIGTPTYCCSSREIGGKSSHEQHLDRSQLALLPAKTDKPHFSPSHRVAK